jgi:hypothetical protein
MCQGENLRIFLELSEEQRKLHNAELYDLWLIYGGKVSLYASNKTCILKDVR